MSGDLCSHFKEYGEGVEWPIQVSLQHFDYCLPSEARTRRFEQARDAANRGLDCAMHDHLGRIESQRVYTLKLLAGIRALIDEGSRDGAYIRSKLGELIR